MLKHKKLLYGSLAAILCLISLHAGELLSMQTAFAEAAQGVQGNLGSVVSGISKTLGVFITFMQVALLTTLWIAQSLLSNNYFSNPTMIGGLKSIWIFSRDIMNLFFALILIGVAFYTIIVANGEFVKGKIVHFILALIFVNFSWFFPRVIIDIANVLTATIYSIPQVMNFECTTIDENGERVPCKVITGVFIFMSEAEVAFLQGQNPPYKCYPPLYCYQKSDYRSAASSTSGHTMLNALAVNFAKLATLAQVPANPNLGPALSKSGAIQVTLHVTISIIAVFLVQLSLLAPLIALIVALLMRIILLWITIAFMPFAFLGYAINGKLGTNVFGLPNDYIWKNFWTAAFLPTLVAIPFTIGFVMLSAFAPAIPDGGQFIMRAPIINGVTTWWDLVWLIAAAVVIWKGTFAAFGANEFIGKATEKIHSFSGGIAKSIGQLPLLTPLPIPGGSIGGVVGKVRELQRTIDLRARGGIEGTTETQRRRAAQGLTQDFTANNQNALGIEEAIRRLQQNPGDRADLQHIAQILERHNVQIRPEDALTELRRILNEPEFQHPRQRHLLQQIDAIGRPPPAANTAQPAAAQPNQPGPAPQNPPTP